MSEMCGRRRAFGTPARAWFDATDLDAQKKMSVEMQIQAFENVPYWPLGLAHRPTAFCIDITGVPEGC